MNACTGCPAAKKLLDELTRGGRWHAVPQSLLRALRPNAAMILLTIVNTCRFDADDDGYAVCWSKFMFGGSGVPVERQQPFVDKLLKLGLIERQFRGRNRAPWYRPVPSAIRQLLERTE